MSAQDADIQNQEAALVRDEMAAKNLEGDEKFESGIIKYSQWLNNQTSTSLFERIDSKFGLIENRLGEIENALADKNTAEVARLLDIGKEESHVYLNTLTSDIGNILGILQNRNADGDERFATIETLSKKLNDTQANIDAKRGEYTSLTAALKKEAEIQKSDADISDAEAKLAEATERYYSSAAVYSEGNLELAKKAAFEAQDNLLAATEVLIGQYSDGVFANEKAEDNLRKAAVLRVQIQSRLAEIFSLMGQKNPDQGRNYLSAAIRELNIAFKKENMEEDSMALEEDLQFADELDLNDHYDIELKLAENCAKSDYVIPPLAEDRMKKEVVVLQGVREETTIRSLSSVNNLIPDLAEHDLNVRLALKQGQVYLQNGRYAQARECFEQALVEDPYCLAAIRALAKIDETMASAANEKLETIIKDRMAEVRWKWSDPVTPLMAGSADSASSQTIRKNDDIQGINKRLDDIVIQNLVIDNEKLKDVLTEILPREIKKADPEGIGINIVPMLVPMAD
ncbi:MAG: tetratricopeptide repeat protein, partial [Lentisphaeria bacterium]|nr:tetratricopeptide repeat protein [Lentisphaeria bacterium]